MASVPRGTRRTTWTIGVFELKVTTRSKVEMPSSLSCHSAVIVVAVVIVLAVAVVTLTSSLSSSRCRRR